MSYYLQLVTITVTTLALLYWARSWNRKPKPSMLALFRSILMLDVALIVGGHYSFLADLIEVPALPQLLLHISGLVSAYYLQVFTLYLRQVPAEAVSKVAPRRVVLLVALAGLVVLYLLGPLPAGIPAINASFTDVHLVVPYLLVFELYAGWIMLDVLWTTRHASRVPRRFLRLGLRLLGVGSFGGFLFVVHKAAQMLNVLPWSEYDGYAGVGTLLVTISTTLMVCGITVPTIGSRWERRQAHRQLEPLWSALTECAPGAVFTVHGEAAPDPLRLRVTAIEDVLAGPLRSYLWRDAAERAEQLGQQAGLEGEELDAVVQASTIAVAVQAVEHGAHVEAGERLAVTAGADQPDDIARLVRIANAFAHSPLVQTTAKEFASHEHADHVQ